MFLGLLQFSTRFRARHLRPHRILGGVYVGAIFVAAPTAIAISWGSAIIVGTCFQAGLWMLCTLLALVTARNRHLAQHRQWMIRSYAVTFTFVSLRILNFWPAYLTMSDANETLNIIVVTAVSGLVVPAIAFHWREITSRRG